ncbi:glycosyltransferase, partial [Clostridium saudiense]|nr:glycosyltransferase [Clostridium saudiense]
DILHAHYASSYGLLGALSNYHPYVVSLWGSDILLFPKEGLIQREIIKYNLRKADRVFSTSKYMMEEANNYTNKKIDITPFGIDLSIFNNRNIRKDDELVIGIVKSLEKIYGIDYLINAFSILLRKYPQYNIKLKILGEGTQKRALEKLAEDLSISERVEFLESRDLIGVSDFYNEIHIGVFPSLSESFGVTILEAQACGVPVVVSDIKAFYESTIPGETSLICKVKDVDSIVEALENILLNKDLY